MGVGFPKVFVVNGSDVADYEDLANLPAINATVLLGNQTGDDLGLLDKVLLDAPLGVPSLDAGSKLQISEMPLASKTEAEAGAVETGLMTPLRTKQAIDALVPTMTGATDEDDGASGLVPAPSAGDEAKFLTGAGTFSAIPNEIETLRKSASFTLGTYADGKKLRIANTHESNTITVTLPSGQTMNGQTSFTIAPDTILEFELIGTVWKCVSNEWEKIGAYSSIITPIPMAQYKEVKIEVTRSDRAVMATATSNIDSIISQTLERRLYAQLNYDNIDKCGVYITFDESKNITSIADISGGSYIFGGLYLYGKK